LDGHWLENENQVKHPRRTATRRRSDGLEWETKEKKRLSGGKSIHFGPVFYGQRALEVVLTWK